MSQIAGLQDFRKQGPPGDIGTFMQPATALCFQFTFSGTTTIVAMRVGISGWVLIDQGTVAATVINAALTEIGLAADGEVVVLEGEYTILATLNVHDGVLFRGTGWATIFNYNASGNCITAYDSVKIRDLKIVITAGAGEAGARPNGVFFEHSENIEVSGLWLVGDATVGYDGSDARQNGIYLSQVYGAVITGNFGESWGISISLYVTTDASVHANNCYENLQHGIYFSSGGYCSCVDNNCTGNLYHGIYVESAYEVVITGSTCHDNEGNGILLIDSYCCPITGNSCAVNLLNGIAVERFYSNPIVGNVIESNTRHGIYLLDTYYNPVIGNICDWNDYDWTNTYDGINIDGSSDNNLVFHNTCNDNDRYGICISVATCVKNWVKNNLLLDNAVAPFFDGGTDTKLAVKTFQFTVAFGGDAAWKTTSPTGIQIDAAGETALAVGEAPLEVQMAVRFRVKGVALGATGAGKGMLLEININAGKPTGSEAYNAKAIAVASVISTEDNVALNDAIEWIIDATDDVDVADIEFGETMEMFAIFEDAGADGDIATNAAIRTLSMEYV